MLARLLEAIAPALCVACGCHAGHSEPLCSSCRARLSWLGPAPERCGALVVWAPLSYDGPARAVVGALKYRGLWSLVELMAAHMAANAPPGLLAGRALVPVPVHPARRRRRGFNQAERLAVALGQRTGADVCDCLRRWGSRRAQVGRARSQRLASIDGSVGVRRGAPAPARALLVDDVITTGATLAACAGALVAGGAADVAAIAYARTPGR